MSVDKIPHMMRRQRTHTKAIHHNQPCETAVLRIARAMTSAENDNYKAHLSSICSTNFNKRRKRMKLKMRRLESGEGERIKNKGFVRRKRQV